MHNFSCMISPETFIQDFRDLRRKSPQCGSWARASENCDYGDIMVVSKDSYMCFNSGNCQNAYYCEDSRQMTDCCDCTFCEGCELCYECVDCDNCYDCNYSQDCSNCRSTDFSYGCKRCKNCFGSVDLRDKEYCMFNEQLTKEEYEKRLNDFDYASASIRDAAFAKVEALKLEMPRMYTHQLDNENCTGDYVYHSKNCHICFDTRHTEDSGYIIQANLDMGTKDSWDCGPIPTGMDLCYDVGYAHYLFNCHHLYFCGNLKECNWCTDCFESANLFGCVFLKNFDKGYHILNEEVSEEDFKRLVPRIEEVLKNNGIYDIWDLINKEVPAQPVIEARDMKRICLLCESDFVLVNDEVKFLDEHKQVWPMYCPPCRASHRINLQIGRAHV